MKPKFNPFHRTSLPLALLALAVSQSVQAADTATTQWKGGDPSNVNNWGTPGNWIGAGNTAGGPNLTTLSVKFDSNATNYLTNIGAAKIAQGVWLADGVGGDVTISSANASAQQLTITGTATLNGQTNAGIIMTDSGNHNLTIGPKANILLSNNTGFYNQGSSASTLTISGGLNLNGRILTIGAGGSSTGNVTISGNISNSAGSITVNSAGTVTLSGTNAYSGGTTVNLGTLSFANGSLGTTGAITVNGGTLQWNGSNTQDISSRLTLQNSGTATLNTNGNNVTLASAFGGSTSSSLTKTGAGTLTLSVANTYTGATNISGGTLVAGNVAALGGSLTAGVFISTASGAGTLQLSTDTSVNAYTIRSSSANQGTIVSDRATAGAGITHALGTAHLGGSTYHITKGSNVTSGTAAVSFASINVAGSAGSTTRLNPTTADLLVTGAVNIASSNGNKTLELGGTSQGSAISGVISDNSNGATGTLSLTKSGAGTWTLTNANNSYSGNTLVTGGKLVVNGNISTSPLTTVAATAALGGTGTLGAVTISGILAPGNSIGTITALGDVTWNDNDSWVFELGSPAASLALANSGTSIQDMLNITGAGSDFIKGTGSSFTFDFANTGAVGFYKLVDWAGTSNFSSGDFLATNLTSGLTGTFMVDGGTSALYLNVVPEPRAALIGGLGLLALMRRRRV